MTLWKLRCERCGRERDFDVGFNLTIFGSSIFLYCPSCKSNTTHYILGLIDDETGNFVGIEKLLKTFQQRAGEIVD